jgi:hypothetical protein
MSSVPESEYAERTVTESDPYGFYCPQCRTTYDFPWLRAHDCTCQSIQDFIVQHNASHDTKRLQVNTPVNIRSAEKLGLVDDERESAAQLRVDLPQDLRTRIADAIKAAHSELNFSLADTWDDKCLRLADAVIRELGLPDTWGKPSFANGDDPLIALAGQADSLASLVASQREEHPVDPNDITYTVTHLDDGKVTVTASHAASNCRGWAMDTSLAMARHKAYQRLIYARDFRL